MATLDSGLGTRSRRWTRLAWLGAAVAALALLAWYVTHPSPLPPTGEPVEATTRVDRSVFVGVPTGGQGLTVRSWSYDVEGGRVDLLVCRGGAIGVTADPSAFCTSVERADGAQLDPGDQLVLQVSTDAPGTVSGGPLHLSWRRGIQIGEQDTGRPVEVTVLQ